MVVHTIAFIVFPGPSCPAVSFGIFEGEAVPVTEAKSFPFKQ